MQEIKRNVSSAIEFVSASPMPLTETSCEPDKPNLPIPMPLPDPELRVPQPETSTNTVSIMKQGKSTQIRALIHLRGSFYHALQHNPHC